MFSITRMLLSYCRSNMYFVIGICIGLSISLVFTSLDSQDLNGNRYNSDSLPFPLAKQQNLKEDEYEPRLNLKMKPQKPQKSVKMFVRPRYYSTELGIREKLFVGVITSQEYLYNRGIALNKTIGHLVDKIRYFITVSEGTKPNVTLPGIVGFTDTRSILKPFHVLKYITDNYLEDYDYYFLVKDMSFVNTRKLVRLISEISVSQNVHLGISGEIGDYCSLDTGVILSNSILCKLKNNLDWCVRNTFSESDDINFGRCVLHSFPVPCSQSIQGQSYHSYKLKPSFNFDTNLSSLINEEGFKNAITIYPIYDHSMVYRLNAYFASVEIMNVENEIRQLREEILKTVHLEPKNQRRISWPIGNEPGHKPQGRFDVLRWVYFNETHSFLETDHENLRELKGNLKMDIDHVLKTVVRKLSQKYNGTLRFRRLINGYKKFDASRGMDYILDLSFTDLSTGQSVVKRVEVCKPLGQAEILPVPYVTESSRVNMILVVDLLKKDDALEFVTQYEKICMQKKDKTFLMLVLLYNPESPSRGKEDVFYDIKQMSLSLTDKYKKEQLKISWLSVRLPMPIESIQLDPMLQIAVADLITKKFSAETLILFVETKMEFKSDYLNRIRMNTIVQFQVFSPIPFSEYNPDIAYMEETKKVIEMDINRNHGRYDVANFNSVSFYVKDYIAMRKSIDQTIPLVKSDKDISTILKLSKESSITSIFDLFVRFTDLHAFRAVEPSLKVRYKDINCDATFNDDVYKVCLKQRTYSLGHRSQLAKLILDYQKHHPHQERDTSV